MTFCYIYIESRGSRGFVFVFFVICCCGGGVIVCYGGYFCYMCRGARGARGLCLLGVWCLGVDSLGNLPSIEAALAL